MKQLIKRLLPQKVLRSLHRLLWNPARNMLWKRLGLTYVLRSGLTVRVGNPADWEIYNEVFVNGEYDAAIFRAFERCVDDEIRVLDLGANVGYFVFRCADLFFLNCKGKRLSVIAVEGAPRTAADLRRRIDSETLLRDHVRVIHGLVGERSGSAFISDSASHYGNSLKSRAETGAIGISYVDLERALGSDQRIDFLKCDIEGSEFSFVRNYSALLSKVTTAVFEFHNYGEDVDHCRSLLLSYGFHRRAVLRETKVFSIEMFEHL